MQNPAYLSRLAHDRARDLILESARIRRRPQPAKPALHFEVRALQFLDAERADRR